MKTLPGKFYNPDTKELHNGTQSEANWWHMYQTLVGDATDGYSGLPSVGPKNAEKILDKSADDLWPLVVDAYVSKGLTEEDALLQARMAKILTKDLYDQTTKEVKLWVPA
jgi:DNA polymerase-1